MLTLFAGCSGHPSVGSSTVRETATGIDTGDAIVVTLNSLKQCGKKSGADCITSTPSTFYEANVERCMGSELQRRIKNVVMVPASKLRGALATGTGSPDSPRSVEAILAALGNPTSRARLNALRIKYVVVVDIQTGDSQPTSKFDFGAGQAGFGVSETRRWSHTATLTAAILDAREEHKAGVITAASTGTAAYVRGLLVILVIPVPFAFPTSFSGSESLACSQLADEVAKFVLDRTDVRTANAGGEFTGSRYSVEPERAVTAQGAAPTPPAQPSVTQSEPQVAVMNASEQAPAAAPVAAKQSSEISAFPKVGDRWSYKLSSRAQTIGMVTIEVVESRDGKARERITREGYPRFVAEREVDAVFNPTRFQPPVALPGGYQLWEFAPYFPPGTELNVGKGWGPISGQFWVPQFGTRSLLLRVRVVGEETVRVPSGEVRAWKLETEPATVGITGNNAVMTSTFWYSAESMRTIKMRFDIIQDIQIKSDSETYELVRFDPAKN